MSKQSKRWLDLAQQKVLEKPPSICIVEDVLGRALVAAQQQNIELNTIADMMQLDLDHITFEPADVDHIQGTLSLFGLECGPEIEWSRWGIITEALADLLDSSPTDMGVDQDTTNQMEERGVITVGDLLGLDWGHICTWVDNLANFGPKTLTHLQECIEESGFCGRMVAEKDAPEEIRNQFYIMAQKNSVVIPLLKKHFGKYLGVA